MLFSLACMAAILILLLAALIGAGGIPGASILRLPGFNQLLVPRRAVSYRGSAPLFYHRPAQAQAHLPFRVPVPSYLPAEARLSAVQVMTDPTNPGVSLDYDIHGQSLTISQVMLGGPGWHPFMSFAWTPPPHSRRIQLASGVTAYLSATHQAAQLNWRQGRMQFYLFLSGPRPAQDLIRVARSLPRDG